ncbi:MAG: hypothetical protein ACHP84_03705 [Caulobacterales bacterium]
MGEVFNALEVMNRTLNLGLSHTQLLGCEMGFKSEMARRGNPNPTAGVPQDPVALAEGFELVVSFRPRAQKLTLSQLSDFARRTAANPQVHVNPRTMSEINSALNGASSGMQSGPPSGEQPRRRRMGPGAQGF